MPRIDVAIKTRDGACPASLFTPAGSKGPWPAVIFFMDGLGIRPVMWEMGQRLADGGYLVLLPDLYYRLGSYPPDGPRGGARRSETARRADEIRQQPGPRSQARRCPGLHRIPVIPARCRRRPVRCHGLLHGWKLLPDRRRRFPGSVRSGRVLSRRQSRQRQARQPASFPGQRDRPDLCRRRDRRCVLHRRTESPARAEPDRSRRRSFDRDLPRTSRLRGAGSAGLRQGCRRASLGIDLQILWRDTPAQPPDALALAASAPPP